MSGGGAAGLRQSSRGAGQGTGGPDGRRTRGTGGRPCASEASRLLVAERGPGGGLFASEFARLPGYLPPGSLLVLNARLAVATAGTGGRRR